MADTAVAAVPVVEQHEDLPSLPSSPSQKRKRLNDSSSPETRKSKRSAPAATMANMANDIEAAAAAFMQVSAAHDASHLSAADFSALQQATVEHPAATTIPADPTDPANASTTAAAALGTMFPTIHIPQPTEVTFETQYAAMQARRTTDYDGSHPGRSPDSDDESGIPGLPLPPMITAPQPDGYRPSQAQKPAVGSEEWHKMRKDNHKEVERRRRETINEGINELSKIVPGCEKNKGSILQRAVAFIMSMKENEQQNIEKWTLEKLLTEQAVGELSASNEKLKAELQRVYRDLESWKRAASDAGVPAPGKETSTSASS